MSSDRRYTDPAFIAAYAALWSFGYLTGRGESEAVYRTIAEILASTRHSHPVRRILDAGCGVGRTTADAARHYPDAQVLGIDESPAMIGMAKQIVCGRGPLLRFDLRDRGMRSCALSPLGLANVEFEATTLERFAARTTQCGSFDIVVSMNVLDRVHDAATFLSGLARLLSAPGTLVLATPLNFRCKPQWGFAGRDGIVRAISRLGLVVSESFDGLPYREALDGRGAYQEFPTLVVKATKQLRA